MALTVVHLNALITGIVLIVLAVISIVAYFASDSAPQEIPLAPIFGAACIGFSLFFLIIGLVPYSNFHR